MRNNDIRISRAIAALSARTSSDVAALGPFTAAITLWALPQHQQLAPLRQTLTQHIKKRLSPQWITNGDAPAVYASLAALAQQQSALSGSHIALAVRRLLACEVSVGGPYVLSDGITFGANAVVAGLLRCVAKIPPGLHAYLQKTPQSDPSITAPALAFVLRQAGYDAPAINAGAQLPHGLWPGTQLITTEPASPLATTALALHALCDNTNRQHEHDAVIQKTRALFSSYNAAIAHTAAKLITRLARADTTHEIALLPYLFARDLARRAPDPRQINDLCVANVCGWLAYMAYDGILDGDGSPAHLPVANIAARLSLQLFQKHAPQPGLVAETFATMDQANAWELATTRWVAQGNTITIGSLPDYDTRQHLAQRSAGHALGPLLIAANSAATATQLRNLQKGLHHFLIARQLADDLLDWQQDITAGHASFVVSAILRDVQLPPGAYQLTELIPAMRTKLATHTQQRIGNYLLAHAKRARQHLTECDLVLSHNHLFTLVDGLAKIGQDARDSSQVRQEFLAEYR